MSPVFAIYYRSHTPGTLYFCGVNSTDHARHRVSSGRHGVPGQRHGWSLMGRAAHAAGKWMRSRVYWIEWPGRKRRTRPTRARALTGRVGEPLRARSTAPRIALREFLRERRSGHSQLVGKGWPVADDAAAWRSSTSLSGDVGKGSRVRMAEETRALPMSGDHESTVEWASLVLDLL